MAVSTADEIRVKLVLAGAEGSGRAEWLAAFAKRMGNIPVRQTTVGETRVRRTEFVWPQPLPDGRLLRLLVFATTGPLAYNAIEQLLMQQADGVAILFDASPERLQASRDALLRAADNIQRAGHKLGTIPTVVQYHHIERHHNFSAEKLDAWIGLPADRIPRFSTPSHIIDAPDAALDTLVAEISRKVSGKHAA